MWSVVAFDDDKTVEVVPSNWIKNNICAWPKRNSAISIKKRFIPTKTDFVYVSARKLTKDTDDFLVARSMTRKAQYTSNLSSAENDCVENKVKRKKKKDIEIKKNERSLWSPESYSNHDDSDADPNYEINKSLHHTDELSISDKIKIGADNSSLELINYKKKLNFDDSYKSTCHKEYSSPVRNSPNKSSKKQALAAPDSMIDSRCVSKEDQIDLFPTIIMTSSSPFKVTSELTGNAANIGPIGNSINNSSKKQALAAPDSVIDMLTNINRTSLNIWYEMRSLSERIDILLEKSNNSSYNNIENTMEQSDIILNLPLKNEVGLLDFEQKLLDSGFKMKVVSELSRLVRSTIQSTVRNIIRYLFSDELLQHYSYKGQKKKLVFSTLGSCSVIFDSIKKIPKFKHYDTIDVENTIKIFISGAKFRLIKTPHNQTANNEEL